MIAYVDTSVLVAALTNERETRRMQGWLADQSVGMLAISDWVVTEFSAALSLKVRTGQIDKAHRAEAMAAFAKLSHESLDIFAIGAVEFRAAAHFCDQYASGLRAGDALHIAVAANRGARLVTLDKKLSDAGAALNVRTRLL